MILHFEEKKMQDTIIPIIHLNGTSKESLLDGYVEVYKALKFSVDKLYDAAPNGRDYYVHRDGEKAFRKARKQHEDRINKIQLVMNEIEYIINSIDCE
jgi:hypothetical protein